MNDDIAYKIAEHLQRLADAMGESLRRVDTMIEDDRREKYFTTTDRPMTMRDRFALAVVAGHDHWVDGREHGDRARDVFDFAQALDDERKRRNAADLNSCLCIVGCSINGECPLHGDTATGKPYRG